MIEIEKMVNAFLDAQSLTVKEKDKKVQILPYSNLKDAVRYYVDKEERYNGDLK